MAADCWLPFGISPASVPTPEMRFGRPEGPAWCPVCDQHDATWELDERGVVFDHPRRAFPCRLRVAS